MNKSRNQNVLLVEIMIAVLFFMLCSGVLLETFMAAREYERRSFMETEALIDMQSISEKMYASENAEGVLRDSGFVQEDGKWLLDMGEYVFEAEIGEEMTEAGFVRNTVIRTLRDGQTVMEIPGARYLPGGEAQ